MLTALSGVATCRARPLQSSSTPLDTPRRTPLIFDDPPGRDLQQENSGTQFKAHTRVISDLDWSSTDPNYFATSSVDTFIFLWDIRDSRRPALSLSAVAGASQVKWNKVEEGWGIMWSSRIFRQHCLGLLLA
jgi:WD40 repeat protein